LLLVLFPMKMAWMVMSPNPQYVPTLATWERDTATVVRWLFVAAILVIPLSGFLFAASTGDPVSIGDLITIPGIGKLSTRTRHWLSNTHYYGAYGCAALIALHVLAALKHHFIDGNATLRRMIFTRR